MLQIKATKKDPTRELSVIGIKALSTVCSKFVANKIQKPSNTTELTVIFYVNKKRPISDVGRLYLSKTPVLNHKCGEFIEHIFKHVPRKGIIFLIVEKTMIKHWVSVDTL